MTKVNLLPDYIWEGKRTRQTALLVAGVVVLELLALGFFYTQKTAALTDVTQQRDEEKVKADAVDKINSDATGILATIKPITDRTEYISAILAHDQKFPNLFDRTNMYTYSKVGYRDLQPAGTVLNMTGNAKSVSDIGRYLLNIQRAKDTFTTVSITSAMPGWPSSGSDTSGGGAAPVATNPTSPTSPFARAPFGQGGGGNPGYGGYPGGGGVLPGATAVASAGPALLDFTAVGALTEKYTTLPPVFQGAGATDATGATGGAPGGYGGYPTPGGSSTGYAYPGAGAAGGGAGANGGGGAGANGGS